MARHTAEGGKCNRTVRTRGVVGGVTPRQDGIGCYATGHQSYLYTGPLVPLFSSPSSTATDQDCCTEARLWDVCLHRGSSDLGFGQPLFNARPGTMITFVERYVVPEIIAINHFIFILRLFNASDVLTLLLKKKIKVMSQYF